MSCNPGLRRYFLATEHSATHAGHFGLFDAPEPWGPWTTVAYYENVGEGRVEASAFYWNFPTKWLSQDGERFTMVFTGKNSNDSWNTVGGMFHKRNMPRVVKTWGGKGNSPGEFRSPIGIAIDAADIIPHAMAVDSRGFVHVIDASNHRTQKFAP